MDNNKFKRLKMFLTLNKKAVVYFTILILYTLIMIGIIMVFSKDMHNCSSGSLSSAIKSDKTAETTTEGITTSDLN